MLLNLFWFYAVEHLVAKFHVSYSSLPWSSSSRTCLQPHTRNSSFPRNSRYRSRRNFTGEIRHPSSYQVSGSQNPSLSRSSDSEIVYKISSTSRFGWFLCVFGRAQFGPGSVKTSLPKLLDALGAKKALAATGNSLYNKVLTHRTSPSVIT